jgi:hypothetical protein
VPVSGRLLEPSASAGYSIQLVEGDASKTVESSRLERPRTPIVKDLPTRDWVRAAIRRNEEHAVIIRIFRPTIYPGKESEFESFLRPYRSYRSSQG